MPTDCIINVKFQKMNQNNSILIAIFAQQATWLAIEDVIKVLYSSTMGLQVLGTKHFVKQKVS